MPSVTIPRRIYQIAAILGLFVLGPFLFMEPRIAADYPPALTHPVFFYGFVGLAIVFQLVFLVIARDPIRYRALMPITWLEKLAFVIPCAWMYATGREPFGLVAGGILDFVLGICFVVAYVKTPASAT